MNWKLIILLSLSSIAVALAGVFVPTQRIEWVFWLVIFTFNAWMLAHAKTGRYFAHGWLISVVNGVWISVIHAAFFTTYVATNPETMATYNALPHLASPQMTIILMGPIFGAVFGLVSGLFAWAGSKVFRSR